MKYVSITYKDRFIEVQSGEPFYLLGTSGHGFGVPTILERIELGDDKVAFRLLPDEAGEYWGDKPAGTHGYVTADPTPMNVFVGDDYLAGTVRIVWQESPGELQEFTEIWLPDDCIALQTNSGHFVTAEADGNGSPLAISRVELGPWEKFNYTQPPPELLPQEPSPVEDAVGGVENLRVHVEGHDDNDIRNQIFRPLNP